MAAQPATASSREDDVLLNCVHGASLIAFRRGLRSIGIASPRVIGHSDPRACSRILGLTPNTETTYGSRSRPGAAVKSAV